MYCGIAIESKITAIAVKRPSIALWIGQALKRDATGYQIGLYEVKIPVGATAVTAEMLTDHRLNTHPAPNDEPVCGMCCGAMMPDTRLAYETFLSRFNEFLTASESQRNTDRLELLTLISDLRGILASEPVGYLQNQIDTLVAQDNAIKTRISVIERGYQLTNANKLSGYNLDINNLTNGDILQWNGSQIINIRPGFTTIFGANYSTSPGYTHSMKLSVPSIQTSRYLLSRQ